MDQNIYEGMYTITSYRCLHSSPEGACAIKDISERICSAWLGTPICKILRKFVFYGDKRVYVGIDTWRPLHRTKWTAVGATSTCSEIIQSISGPLGCNGPVITLKRIGKKRIIG